MEVFHEIQTEDLSSECRARIEAKFGVELPKRIKIVVEGIDWRSKLLRELENKTSFYSNWTICKDITQGRRICLGHTANNQMFRNLAGWLEANNDEYYIGTGYCSEHKSLSIFKMNER